MDVNYNVTYGNENELKCTGNINSENETGNESEKHRECEEHRYHRRHAVCGMHRHSHWL